MTLRQQNKGLYWAWKAMKQRCLNPRCKAYHNYGGRGISICKEWYEFEPFCQRALSNGYVEGLDLDRADNDGDYCPENCRWLKRRANINNRRCTTLLTVNGETLPRTVWAERAGVPSGVIKFWVSKHGTEYAEARIAEALVVGYKERDYIRNHKCTPVLCVETGVKYETTRAAARELGLNAGNINRVVNKGGTTGGYHFKRIDGST